MTQFCLANADRGIYIGLDVGYSAANYHKVKLVGGFKPSSIRDSGVAPRLFLGIDVNRYVGAEMNIIYFQKPLFTGLGYTLSARKTKHNLVYFALKLSLPLPRGVAVYGKAGIGYIVRDGFNVWYYRVVNSLKSGEFCRPFYSLGINYRVAHHWILDFTWVNSPPRGSEQFPVSNFFGVGAMYKFYF